MSKRWTSAVLALLIVGAGTAGVVAASSGSEPDQANRAGEAQRASEFQPKSLKGKWTGAWENLTFGSEGDILANVKVKDGKFIPLVDFSGDVLGCPDPPADLLTLKEGEKKNQFNEDGFKVVTDSEAFGDLKFVYSLDGKEVTASGNSPCDPSISFTMTGKLTSSSFTGDVAIDLGGGDTATAELSAKEQ